MTLYVFLRSLLAPPGLQVLLVLAGLWCLRRQHRRTGRLLTGLGLASLYLLATPLGAGLLASGLERYPALDLADRRQWQDARVVVVLGAGRYAAAPEFAGADMPNWWGASRLRYAARLYRETGLPLLTSGGTVLPGETVPEAAMMADSLRRDYVVNVRWQETASRTTWENATDTRALLAAQGIDRILLVTQALHMPRAVLAFRHAGFSVVPAPVDFDTDGARLPWLLQLAPSPERFMRSAQALHEYAGLLFYRLRLLAS